MKKIFSWLASLFLISSSSPMVISCWWDIPELGLIYADCYDEDGNNIGDVGSDNNQWWDFFDIRIFLLMTSNDIFPDSNSFYQNLNNASSKELYEKYFRGPEGEIIDGTFSYDFTLLITNYDSIDRNVIANMKQNDLANKEEGTYLFLNLPEINLENIKNEININFQFIYIIKDANGNIKCNNNNNWFYWYNWNIINDPTGSKYFLNINPDTATGCERVVTKYWYY